MRNRIYVIANTVINGVSAGVLYYPSNTPTFSARRQDSLIGVFSSQPIDGGTTLAQWQNITWSVSSPAGTDVLVFTKNADSVAELVTTLWQGPLYNGIGEDLSIFTKRYLQVRVVLNGIGWTDSSVTGVTPIFNSFSVQGIQSGSEETVYTKAFDLGFIPQYIVVTYDGNIPAGSVLQLAVAGDDTISAASYLNIAPNRIQSLANLPDIASKFKLMISAFGNKLEPFEISKIGILVSGSGQINLNQ